MRAVNGVHVSNSRHWHVEQMLRAAKQSGAVTILHHMMFPEDRLVGQQGDVENAYWYWKLRHGWAQQGIPAAPERLIHVRLFQPNWRDYEPQAVARQAVALLSNWRFEGLTADLWDDPLLCVSPCNEQNLEPVGNREYALHARWQLDYWSEMDRLRPDRRALSCLGAWAYGTDVIPDVPDSEYTVPEVRELLEYVDILATHPYAHLDWPEPKGSASADPERDAYWHLLRDFRPEGWRDSRQPGRPHDIGGILAQVPGKPLLISESGTFTHSDPGRTPQTLAAMRLLLETAARSGRCLGVTWFIWNSGPEHQANLIWPNEALRNGLEALPAFETTATVPVRGQGGSSMEDRFWPILERWAQREGVPARDARRGLMTGGSFSTLTPSKVQAVVLHHTAAAESVTWESVARYHVQSRGFAGIGYHVGVRHGEIAYLGDLDEARAHVANANHLYLGLVLAGNYETAVPSDANLKALKVAYGAISEWLGRSVPLRGHREVAPAGYTVCPGRNLYARMGAIAGEGDAGLAQALLKWADVGQSIQPNEPAALYREMRADGYWPLSDESGTRGQVPVVEGFPGIVAQLGRDWDGPSERVYYWDGQAVRWVARAA